MKKRLPRDIDKQVLRAVNPQKRHCIGEEIPPHPHEGVVLHA
jgi:hypothetical protein